MARVVCPPGQWTDVPGQSGNMLLEARFSGVYVDTGGGKPADPTETFALTDGMSRVIAEGVAVAVWPISDKATEVFVQVT